MFHVVTGGSGSGKSAYAEQLILDFGEDKERVYIATMYPGTDEENHRRIQRHREMRARKNFSTEECYLHLETVNIPKGSVVLLDCMSNLVANELFMHGGASIHTVNAVLAGLEHILQTAEHLVVVTNEVFSDGAVYDTGTRLFLEYLGAINQEAAHWADKVTEVVYGIPVPVKERMK